MKVLSINENEFFCREADELCSIIEKNNDQLFKCKLGNKVSLGQKIFSCISADKNIIYSVRGKNKWFLKFSMKEEWIQHEIAGAESVKATLANFSGYQHAKAIRASIKERYTLYSAVEGKSFNRIILEACLLMPFKLRKSYSLAMENLGRSLGLLHSYDYHADLIALNPDNMFYLRNYLNNIKERNVIINKISDWVTGQEGSTDDTGWIHGNIKSEDVFIDNGKICIIDFGTCGVGVPYEDLTNLCTYMMLLRTVPFFPWIVARQAMSIFLKGYQAEYEYNKNDLRKHITRGILRYYLKNIVMHKGVASLSYMPILRSNIECLVLQLIRGDYGNAFEGIDL